MAYNLNTLDERMAARSDIKTSIIYSMRNWQAYHMQSAAVDNAQYLEKAYLGAMAAHRLNEPSPWLFSLALFMAIESRHLDTANNMLDAAMGYRSFLKANEPFYYNSFAFLRAYLAIIENRARAAKKYHKSFLSQLKSAEYSPHYDVMIGQLHVAAHEYPEAYTFFARAYSYGCRSMYLYEGLFRTISAANPDDIGDELLPVLTHAAISGADITQAVTANEDAVFDAIIQDPTLGERLYNISKHSPLLKPICIGRIQAGDLTLPAHKLYTEASKRQINVRGLSRYIVHSAYTNHIENISSYPLEHFLTTADMKPQLAAYVFHLLLTDPAHKSLMQGRENLAIQAAADCLENGITGREANSLYQFYWTHHISAGITHNLVQKAESELQAGLTEFELTIPTDIRHIYIALQERRGTKEYTIPENTRTLTIEAPNDTFSYKCLAPGRRQVITAPIEVKRVAPLANPALYQYFYDKGDRRFSILAYLASHYLQTEDEHKAIPVYESILADKSLQKPYRMKILAALGHLYHASGNQAKAKDCYAQIDMSTLPQAHLLQTLDVCLQTKDYTLASEIIAQNHHNLPRQAVYKGLHQLLENQSPTTHKQLSEAAYNLLLYGHQSETLLATVLTHYPASQAELKALSDSLKTPDHHLEAKILAGDLYAHQLDAHTQKAFRRLITAQKAQEECAQFIEYATYLMLSQNLQPEYEVINALEKHYISLNKESATESPHPTQHSRLLLLALCHTYLHHNITTFRSDKLLKEALTLQEAEGILLPIFKDTKPIQHPYLEKYQPFLFQSQPNKDIRLNYRLEDNQDFRTIPMQYLAYGLYTAKLPLFYNETITYYYSEEMPTGSITTHQFSHKNITPYLHNHPTDNFFAINNAIIHEHMFRHQEMEDIIAALIQEPITVQSQLL